MREGKKREYMSQRVGEKVEGTMRKRMETGEKIKGDEMESEPQVIEKSLPDWLYTLLLTGI